MKTILITGAAGGIGTFLRHEFCNCYNLRLSDMVPISNCNSNETFIQSNLEDLTATQEIVAGVDGIVHLGGYSVEGDWSTLLPANIIGTYNLFEAARIQTVKRIIFASSNHAVGFYGRNDVIDHTAAFRPDSRYGLTKVFGEALGSLYADKYGAEVLNIRIGNVGEKPIDVRRLSIWISSRDIAQLISIGLEHPDIKYEVVYGMSDNKRAWWDNSNAKRLGYVPEDRSEDYAEQVFVEHSSDTGDELADMLQGGAFVTGESFPNPAKKKKK